MLLLLCKQIKCPFSGLYLKLLKYLTFLQIIISLVKIKQELSTPVISRAFGIDIHIFSILLHLDDTMVTYFTKSE